MRKDIELSFEIGAYTPETMPMERLAEYMGDLAAMLGESSAVHFKQLKKGSTIVAFAVEQEAYPKIQQRVADIQYGNASVVEMNAYRSLNKRLADDNASGELKEGEGPNAKLLDFPGKLTAKVEQVGPVKQAGSIDGVVIRLGGKDATVPVHIQDGDAIYKCNTSRAVARLLGHHIFGDELRFTGVGVWQRNDTGCWGLKSFEIHSFEALDTTPLAEVVHQMRSIENEWNAVDDAWSDLKALRGSGDGMH
ncbi:hypothetical protein [Bosea sp. (in: a-proteobacteria)]|uniref:hypothetical protein n=1 Tax=Bosea sp. (in: a-proteobacteria) TaxID=1871050 RepID=UPI00086B48BA|nr:hypothetical protein [Bosea sp. (in: a-proteobacteria)]MBN9440527.1 hypothetical protein [Bosea sp. (in: a-proteobacteria)]ODT43377.1 MAG: hypothetical protein ABS59_23680 [Methylobacterium sp. SCN 67-24]